MPDKDAMPLNSNPRHPLGCKEEKIMKYYFHRKEDGKEKERGRNRGGKREMIIAKLFIKRASK